MYVCMYILYVIDLSDNVWYYSLIVCWDILYLQD